MVGEALQAVDIVQSIGIGYRTPRLPQTVELFPESLGFGAAHGLDARADGGTGQRL